MTHRPPAVPLVACDPYFSLWSQADRLTDVDTTHWTGTRHLVRGLIRVNGEVFRWLGADSFGIPAAEQVSLEVLPTRTVAVFEAGGARFTVTFTTPALVDDLEQLGRPVTYVDVTSDADISVLLAVSAELAVNTTNQQVTWGRYSLGGGLDTIAVGSVEQKVLGGAGDDLRIDWGRLHLVAPGARTAVVGLGAALRGFQVGSPLPEADDLDLPRGATQGWPALCAESSGDASFVLAYDDLWAVEHLRRRLPAWWKQGGRTFGDLLRSAVADHDSVVARCASYDEELLTEARTVGGDDLAYLVGLAHRQCTAAHKLVVDDLTGRPLHLSKENDSNGCIATVDVTYPAAPFFLLLNPLLLEAQVRPVLEYAASPRWPWPYAPHDLGTYPLANGQVYGGGERTEDAQMPVEECGNMLILVAALAKAQGSTALADEFADTLGGWAAYLEKVGYDPADQLCTDDFAGPMPHNCNLSLKAILGLGAWAQLRGDDRLRLVAQEMADRWVAEAGDGRLAFDQPGTWSLKYNLLWDSLLGLDLFPTSVAEQEVARYRTLIDDHGLPLDSRSRWTKVDWVVWAASLTGSRDDLDAVVGPLVRWADTTPTRVPLTDFYRTDDGRQAGFKARSVVGGVLVPLLAARWREPQGSLARPTSVDG